MENEMKANAGGYVVDLEEETLEERRNTPRRRKDDLERTITENVARLRLENTPRDANDSNTPDTDGVSTIESQYKAFLTDPRRI